MLPGILHELTGSAAILLPRAALSGPAALHGVRLRDLLRGLPQSRGVRLVAGAGGRQQRTARRDQQHAVDGRCQHKRYRALVQPSFLPANGKWWSAELDIRDSGRCSSKGWPATAAPNSTSTSVAAIPLLTITGSFGVPIEQALEIRAALGHDPQKVVDIIRPIVAARREQAAGRPDQHAGAGRTHRRRRRHDPAHRSRDRLVRTAVARCGLGHHMEADGHHARRAAAAAGLLEAVRGDRQLLRPAIEEAVRWMPPIRCSPAR